MKKFICMLLVFLIAAFFITPVYAADKGNSLGPPEIVPQFTHIWVLTPGLEINSSGKATCIGDVTIYDDTFTIVLTVELQKLGNNNWDTIKTWTKSGIGKSGALIVESYYVAKGTYRVSANAKVYNTSGTLLENRSLYSRTVTY